MRPGLGLGDPNPASAGFYTSRPRTCGDPGPDPDHPTKARSRQLGRRQRGAAAPPRSAAQPPAVHPSAQPVRCTAQACRCCARGAERGLRGAAAQPSAPRALQPQRALPCAPSTAAARPRRPQAGPGAHLLALVPKVAVGQLERVPVADDRVELLSQINQLGLGLHHDRALAGGRRDGAMEASGAGVAKGNGSGHLRTLGGQQWSRLCRNRATDAAGSKAGAIIPRN